VPVLGDRLMHKAKAMRLQCSK